MAQTVRPTIQTFLKTMLQINNIYLQPPENVKLRYPCVIYNIDGADIKHADDFNYHHTKRYTVTLLTKDPDDPLFDELMRIPMCDFDRSYRTDYLNHYVFTLYY